MDKIGLRLPLVVATAGATFIAGLGVLLSMGVAGSRSTYVVDGDLVARSSGEQLLALAVGPVLALLAWASWGGFLSHPDRGRACAQRMVLAGVLAGVVATVFGVGAAASTGFDTDATTPVALLALASFVSVHWGVLRATER